MPEDNTAENMHDDDTGSAAESENTTSVDPAANAEAAGEQGFDQVQSVETPNMSSDLTGDPDNRPTADISMILDIPVTLSMEIGQTRISISELLKLSRDSVIELQRMADEPMDVLVNGTLVAHGEAVVVGDRFGIRLTDVISPQERLKKFG
ncbi:flagellar motor switch protein FliN [Granulosicoccus sp. 3-233]|uniref:flagellar motor switch protein FliN n=1 Tax=Granulosicoccus sp. 3-233 TaxID=3417969 RepID=UPI003D34A7BF